MICYLHLSLRGWVENFMCVVEKYTTLGENPWAYLGQQLTFQPILVYLRRNFPHSHCFRRKHMMRKLKREYKVHFKITKHRYAPCQINIVSSSKRCKNVLYNEQEWFPCCQYNCIQFNTELISHEFYDFRQNKNFWIQFSVSMTKSIFRAKIKNTFFLCYKKETI